MKKQLTPPRLYQVSIIFMVIVHFTLPLKLLISFPYTMAGIAVFFVGALYSIKAKKLFKSTNTPMKPDVAPVKLHITRQFKYSRNPMYFGITIGLIGIAIFLGSLTPFVFPVIFFLIMDLVFIPLEEKQLEKFLGKEFIEYKEKVRRWI